MIIEAVLKGLLLGLYLAIQPGPSFFALLQTSTKTGFKSGMGLAIGILLSDLVYVLLAYYGVAQLFDNPENKKHLNLAGGIILVIFGLVSIFNKKKNTAKEEKLEINAFNIPLYVVKGFLLNFLNPAVLLLWIAFVSQVTSLEGFTKLHIIIFFTVTLSFVFSTDMLKAYFANRISQRISEAILKKFNVILGIILLIIGLFFVYRVFL